MVNFKYIGIPLLVGLFGKSLAVDCSFTITDGGCTVASGKTCNTGYHLSSEKLINYVEGPSSCEVVENPLPGFYVNTDGGDGNEYLQCTSKGCSILSKSDLKTECKDDYDGQLVKIGGDVKLCTKINKLNIDGENLSLNVENYAAIEFGDGEGKSFVVHHAGDVFSFDSTATNYVVKKTSNSITFNPEFVDKVDHCADTDGKMMDRKEDFCSSSSSGMYYTCTKGKCVAESQLDSSVKESNGINKCLTITESSCTPDNTNCFDEDNGYYSFVDGDGLIKSTYLYTKESTKCNKNSQSVAGYYWNNRQYNDVISCTGVANGCSKVEFKDSCFNNALGFIDTGYNLEFCEDESTSIPVNSITEHIYVKGNGDGLFTNTNSYYSLKKDEYSLIFDGSYNNRVKIGDTDYKCNSGICVAASAKCNPASTDPNDKQGCNGYYLITSTLYKCEGVNCAEFKLPGLYINNGHSDDESKPQYVKCIITDDNGTTTCTELTAPTAPVTLTQGAKRTSCTKGELVYTSEGVVGICVDGENAVSVFTSGLKGYFIPADILNTRISDNSNKYYILENTANSAIPKQQFSDEEDTIDRHFKYTLKDKYEILDDDSSVCTNNNISGLESELIEYTRDDTGNTYTRETVTSSS